MAVSSGFFDSLLDEVTGLPDRNYDSLDFGSLFDGVITDGIFKEYGNKKAFEVEKGTPNLSANKFVVLVNQGRAWLNKTWTLNSTTYELELDPPSASDNRIDAIYLEIDARQQTNARRNRLIVRKGTPVPGNPTIPYVPSSEFSDLHHFYMIAYVTVKASNEVNNNNITIHDVRGKSSTHAIPYANVVIPNNQTIKKIIDSLEKEFESYKDRFQGDFEDWMARIVGHLGVLSSEQTVRLALMVGEIYRSDYISGEYPFVDDDGGLWLSAKDDGSKPSVDINFGYASLPYAANGRATEVIIHTSEYTIREE